MYTPILVRRTLDRRNILELPNGDALSLKTDLKKFPGILPGAPGISDILERPKSSTLRSWRTKHELPSNADGGVLHLVWDSQVYLPGSPCQSQPHPMVGTPTPQQKCEWFCAHTCPNFDKLAIASALQRR